MRLWIVAFSISASIVAVPFCPAMAAHALPMGSERMDVAMVASEHVHAPTPDCCIGSPIHSTEQAVSTDGVSLPLVTGILPVTQLVCSHPTRKHAHVATDHHPPSEKFESRSKSKRE